MNNLSLMLKREMLSNMLGENIKIETNLIFYKHIIKEGGRLNASND